MSELPRIENILKSPEGLVPVVPVAPIETQETQKPVDEVHTATSKASLINPQVSVKASSKTDTDTTPAYDWNGYGYPPKNISGENISRVGTSGDNMSRIVGDKSEGKPPVG